MKLIKSKTLYRLGQHIKFTATFSLDDDCKNGGCNFSITGTGIALNSIKNGYKAGEFMFGGCCHEEVAKAFPEWKKFIPLHLSNEFGQPMYPVDNFIHHIGQKIGDDKLMEYYRCNQEQLDVMKGAVFDKEYFKYCLLATGLIDKWKTDAEEAIKYLEEATGEKFTHTVNPRFTLEYDTEWMQSMKNRVDAGEFTSEAINLKVQEKIDAEKKKQTQEIEAEYNLSLEFVTRRRELALWCVANCLTLNYRFWAYNGAGFTKQPKYELTINDCSWKEKVTKDEYENWLSNTTIPEGLIVKYKENN